MSLFLYKQLSIFLLTVNIVCTIFQSSYASESDCYEKALLFVTNHRLQLKIKNKESAQNYHRFLVDLKTRTNVFSADEIEKQQDLLAQYGLEKYKGSALMQKIYNFVGGTEKLIEYYQFEIPTLKGFKSKFEAESYAPTEKVEQTINDRIKLKIENTKKGKNLDLFMKELIERDKGHYSNEIISRNWDLVLKYFPKEKSLKNFLAKIRSFYGTVLQVAEYYNMVVVSAPVSKELEKLIDLRDRETILEKLRLVLIDKPVSSVTLDENEARLKEVFSFENLDDFKFFLRRAFTSYYELNIALKPRDEKNIYFYYDNYKEELLNALKESGLPKELNYRKNLLDFKKIVEQHIGREVREESLKRFLSSHLEREVYRKFLRRHRFKEFKEIVFDYMKKDDWSYDLNQPKDNFNHLRELMTKILGTYVGRGKVTRFILYSKLDEFNFEISEIHRIWAMDALRKNAGVAAYSVDNPKSMTDMKTDELIVIDESSNPELMLSSDEATEGLFEIARELNYEDVTSAVLVLEQIILRGNLDLNKIVQRTELTQDKVMEILGALNEKRELLASFM
ncbi:hypothetical protein HBN50_03255 [Halobacteriovorax sp. GB3]|uniref:hypothetical protein n=1 Tax=Halobacteriovorax sp. GB3 TaxID=2719615 RepID=UPI00235E873F|nr:hypothetical protein [Halobacteriovorax sp. GB3]MDD0852094.1 hypothetical protein [Halobacteriovorax sp. GB3]